MAVAVTAIVIGAIALTILVNVFSKIPDQIKTEISFSDRAQELLDQDKATDLIQLAEERVLKFPADSHAHWYLGNACYRVGDLQRALVCLRKTQPSTRLEHYTHIPLD